MSRHSSFGRTGIVKKRNVMKRFERVEVLKKAGKHKQGDSVYGLPKTKVQQ